MRGSRACLGVMLLMAVFAAHARYAHAEVLWISATSIDGVYSSALLGGQWYEVVSDGWYYWDATPYPADTEWIDSPFNGGWAEWSNEAYHPLEAFELHINNAPLNWEGTTNGATWAPHTYSGLHRYRTFLKGSGATVKFHIADTYPYEHAGRYDWTGDNSGGLTVTITATAPPADGSIAAWGRNSSGECDVPLPNEGFVAIAAGVHHSLALRADGSVLAFGQTDFGPVPEPNSGFAAVAAGQWHDLALRQDGSVVAWGTNGHGQLNVPQPNGEFVAIAAGDSHSLGLKQNGLVVAWGNNSYGQLNVPSPNAGFTAIAAGTYHSLGLKSDGAIVAWGFNGTASATCLRPMKDSWRLRADFTTAWVSRRTAASLLGAPTETESAPSHRQTPTSLESRPVSFTHSVCDLTAQSLRGD